MNALHICTLFDVLYSIVKIIIVVATSSELGSVVFRPVECNIIYYLTITVSLSIRWVHLLTVLLEFV